MFTEFKEVENFEEEMVKDFNQVKIRQLFLESNGFDTTYLDISDYYYEEYVFT